ncbi:hypothetical protein JP75_06505 [Devosia riboflavina]|uniref:Uncharacterized protein n=1 Tax=Devosia riboflavina TaxID=46914 RepID=A0A087M4B7_9HYPH|nr:hypothetical protein [Devosia riboflavina]KFL31720.1 hypothetical protein JP75_06505 [Devosia riboflavina]
MSQAITVRPEGHYWVRFGTSPLWDVMYWRDGYFWDTADGGYKADNFEVGPQVFPPGGLRAIPGAEAHPLARFGSPAAVDPGLYRVHWKSGGTSLAAIGMMSDGNRWIAPTNWLRPCEMPSAGEWAEIDRIEKIEAEQEPVAWQRKHPRQGWQFVDAQDIEHYRAHGQEIRPLYLSPSVCEGKVTEEATMDTAPLDRDILVWWPIVAIDEETGDLTDTEVGGRWLVTEWNGGCWLEPDVLNALNSNYFDDDCEYARAPKFWRELPAAFSQEGV